jgi:hypothetical protein
MQDPPPSDGDGQAEAWTRLVRRVYRVLTKPVLALAGLITAIVIVADTLPSVWHRLNWRPVEYTKLASIHAGYELDYVEEVLGPATVVTPLPSNRHTQALFVRREHFVQVVSDRQGRVLLYAVTACRPEFQPTFDAGEGVRVRLQHRPLARAAHPAAATLLGASAQTSEAVNERALSYRSGLTGSSPEYFVEEWPVSIASRNRGYFVAVNPLCLALDELPGQLDYRGPSSSAPPDVRSMRDRLAANTYAEAVPPAGPPLDEEGLLAGIGAPIGPVGFDLPPSFEGEGATRTFE